VLGGDADGLGATDADDADGATLGGGNGADGIVRSHDYLLFSRNHTNLHKKNDN
jgi:hypothetical protein